MNKNELIKKMTSQNAYDVQAASWEIINIVDDDLLKNLYSHIPSFQESLAQTPPEPGLRDRHDDAQLAIAVIQNHHDGKCRCALYTQFDRFNPHQEKKMGCVTIEHSEVHDDLYEEHFTVVCTKCNQCFWVKAVFDYHYPFWEWRHE